ncbi:MAG: DUF1080 domain-containing protein [Ferruginibacter sp.]
MKNLKKIALTSITLFCMMISMNAQKAVVDPGKSFIFSAIKGTISKPDSLMLPAAFQSVKLVEGDTASFKILSFKKGKLIVVFAPSVDFIGLKRAKLGIKNAVSKSVLQISLTGLSTKGLEGENEAPLSVIVDALGYQANVGWPGLANNSLPVLQGDEIPYSLFHKAGKGKVEMVPVARYSPDFELPFGYYINVAEAPQKYHAGVLAARGKYPEHQILFPAISVGSNSFDPGNAAFGFFATSPTHTAFSEDVWNMLYYPANAVHATRVYPLKDAAGKLIANTYLLCFEEAKNGDYNDYVFVIKNVTPVTTDPYTSLFNGKDLSGWHSFLKGIGKNTDPENNFRIEDGALHVIGKNLGYVITDSGFRNYDFKVDFKFGDKRWPPRDTAKRDGGVCYNIPMNEPDSIWPKSIEFQIQQGDVGDFWLLGFSTIKVNGIQNVPANHTRMIKQRDAEKPTGEWNTLELISYNGKCIQIVNGVIVNVGEEASVKSGRILLQSEYAEIYYRNVKIRKL